MKPPIPRPSGGITGRLALGVISAILLLQRVYLAADLTSAKTDSPTALNGYAARSRPDDFASLTVLKFL